MTKVRDPDLIVVDDQYGDLEKPNDLSTDRGTDDNPGNGPPTDDNNEPENRQQPDDNDEPQQRQAGSSDPDDGYDPDGPSPVQQLLTTEFEFENGLINFNGQDVPFDDLSPVEQAEFLGEFINEMRTAERTNALLTGLKDDELRVINMMREPRRDTQAIANYLLGSSSPAAVAKLSDDEVHLRDIKKRLPTLTEAEQQEELADRKGRKHFVTETASLRQEMTAAASTAAERETAQQQEAELTQLVETIAKVAEIDGSPLDDDLRDFLIEEVHEVNPTTGRTNLDELLLEPLNRVKARYWLEFGPQLQAHYTKEVARLVAIERAKLVGDAPSGRNPRGHQGRPHARVGKDDVTRLHD